MLWERPHDLSRVIDALEKDQALAGAIDPQRVAAIGHSLGGWSVTALAGARFDPDLLAKACSSYAQSRSCTVDDLGLDRSSAQAGYARPTDPGLRVA